MHEQRTRASADERKRAHNSAKHLNLEGPHTDVAPSCPLIFSLDNQREDERVLLVLPRQYFFIFLRWREFQKALTLATTLFCFVWLATLGVPVVAPGTAAGPF